MEAEDEVGLHFLFASSFENGSDLTGSFVVLLPLLGGLLDALKGGRGRGGGGRGGLLDVSFSRCFDLCVLAKSSLNFNSSPKALKGGRGGGGGGRGGLLDVSADPWSSG